LHDEADTNMTVNERWNTTDRDASNKVVVNFDYSDDCLIEIYLEEQDSDAVQTGSKIIQCSNTEYGYAPIWLEGDDDNETDNESEHGYYLMVYSIENVYNEYDSPYCDMDTACLFYILNIVKIGLYYQLYRLLKDIILRSQLFINVLKLCDCRNLR
jgi:hypothetical protein